MAWNHSGEICAALHGDAQAPRAARRGWERGRSARAPSTRAAITPRALVALAHVLFATACLAQATAPAPGNVLKDLERSLPTQPITSPEGVQIEIPDAPELRPGSADEHVTVRGYRISGNTVFD